MNIIEKINELKEREKALHAEYSKIEDQCHKDNLSWDEFQKRVKKQVTELTMISQNIRYIKEPTYYDIPKYGNRMSMNVFIKCCKDGSFIDYDGSGNYVKDGKISDITIYPSDITSNNYRKDFTEMIWFNK